MNYVKFYLGVVLIAAFSNGIWATDYFVDGANGNDSNSGTVPAAAFSTIQRGIEAAQDGDVVIICDGVYQGDGNRDISFMGKAITVQSQKGPEGCIIECQGNVLEPHTGFIFNLNEGEGSVLHGVTIKNGYQENGGALQCIEASPSVAYCRFIDNNAGYGGGAVYYESASPYFVACDFANNEAVNRGGAVYNNGDSCEGVFVHCRFEQNIAGSYGGAVFNAKNSYHWFNNCLFTNNRAVSMYGGGIYNWDNAGGVLENCTFVHNRASKMGSALRNAGLYFPTVIITNCIFWNNYNDDGDIQQLHNRDTIPLVSHCCIQYSGGSGSGWNSALGQDEGGNLADNPRFASGPEGDFYLSQIAAGQSLTSPCVDAGSDTADALDLSLCSTRTDHEPDAGQADIGFHSMCYSCVEELAGHYLRQAIEIKHQAQQQLSQAIAMENRAIALLGHSGHGNQAKHKAKPQILVALGQELRSYRLISRSIDRLIEALGHLDPDGPVPAVAEVDEAAEEVWRADANGDGIVNILDFSLIMNHWLESPSDE
ncbi:MAG: hypothetical protein JW709_08155 [Sedimentisphaerales bacterium]|nr:hypothetical protein [Sedimentisphaerales bacterium]